LQNINNQKERRKMKKAIVLLIIVFLAGCSPSSSKLASVAKNESARLGVTARPLSEFSNFELKPMELSAGVSERKEKVEVAKQLEDSLRTRLLPLIEEWKADKASPRTAGTLVIQPKLQSLRIVSGGARFFIGAWSGNSVIDMNLELTDGKTGTIIANPRITQTASATGGAWSVGATDRNLLDYIVEIAYQYLVDNYKKQK
jgi:PBP1b-binding outer membrane lipoprotein LpoB